MCVNVCVNVFVYVVNYFDVSIFDDRQSQVHVTFHCVCVGLVIIKLQEPIKFSEIISAGIFFVCIMSLLCAYVVTYIVWFRLNTIIRTYNNFIAIILFVFSFSLLLLLFYLL